MDNATQQLAQGVWRIEVGPLLNAYLVATDGEGDGAGLTLVDTGTRRSGPRLVRSIRLLGFDPAAINDVVLTHWHSDHMGSAARFAASSATPRVSVGRRDAPPVQGQVPRPHAVAAPGDVTRLGRLLSPVATPGPPVDAVTALDDGMRLEHADDALVVDAPGHTLGSIALLLERAGVLLAGDAVMTIGRVTRGIAPFRSARTQEAVTLQRLAALEFDVLAAGHGPPVVTKARDRLRRLAERVGG